MCGGVIIILSFGSAFHKKKVYLWCCFAGLHIVSPCQTCCLCLVSVLNDWHRESGRPAPLNLEKTKNTHTFNKDFHIILIWIIVWDNLHWTLECARMWSICNSRECKHSFLSTNQSEHLNTHEVLIQILTFFLALGHNLFRRFWSNTESVAGSDAYSILCVRFQHCNDGRHLFLELGGGNIHDLWTGPLHWVQGDLVGQEGRVAEKWRFPSYTDGGAQAWYAGDERRSGGNWWDKELADWLTGWLTGWLTDWLADWLPGWLTDWHHSRCWVQYQLTQYDIYIENTGQSCTFVQHSARPRQWNGCTMYRHGLVCEWNVCIVRLSKEWVYIFARLQGYN